MVCVCVYARTLYSCRNVSSAVIKNMGVFLVHTIRVYMYVKQQL